MNELALSGQMFTRPNSGKDTILQCLQRFWNRQYHQKHQVYKIKRHSHCFQLDPKKQTLASQRKQGSQEQALR